MRCSDRSALEALPPQLASLHNVEYFCDHNDVRVNIDRDAIRREWHEGTLNLMHCQRTQAESYRRVYAPWYTAVGRSASFDHWLKSPWSFATLGNPRRQLPSEHAAQIEAIEQTLYKQNLQILTLAVGRKTLVLDGNHRLAAFLRNGEPHRTVYELRIRAEPGTKIVPDIWDWQGYSSRRSQLGLLAATAGLALATVATSAEILTQNADADVYAANLALAGLGQITAHWLPIKARVGHRLQQMRAEN